MYYGIDSGESRPWSTESQQKQALYASQPRGRDGDSAEAQSDRTSSALQDFKLVTTTLTHYTSHHHVRHAAYITVIFLHGAAILLPDKCTSQCKPAYRCSNIQNELATGTGTFAFDTRLD
jgi:hypothetical protein